MVPRVGNETLRPLGVAMGNAVSVTRVWSIHIKTPPVGWRQPMTSLPARPQYKGRRENTSSTSSSEACVRSMAHSLGDAVSRGSFLHGNFELRPLGVAMGNDIPTPPCWGERKPISCKRRALSQLHQAKGVVPGTVDGCQWHYPLRPKTRAAYPAQGRAQRFGIRERFL